MYKYIIICIDIFKCTYVCLIDIFKCTYVCLHVLFLFETEPAADWSITCLLVPMNPVSALGVGNNHGMFITKKKTGKNTVDEDDEDMELYGILGFDMSWDVSTHPQLVFSCFKLLCQCPHISAYWHHTWPVRRLIHWFKKHVAQMGVWKWGIPGHT